MRKRLLVWIILTICFSAISTQMKLENVGSFSFSGSYHSSTESSLPQLRILESSDEKILLELTTTNYSIKTQRIGDKVYQLIEVTGLTLLQEAGRPQLPSKATLIGIPPNTTVELKEVSLDTKLLPGPFLPLPSPQHTPALLPQVNYFSRQSNSLQWAQKTLREDPGVYTSQIPYPAKVARITDIGYLRNQRFARIEVYPFQYIGATGEVLFHKRIVIELRFLKDSQPSLLRSEANLLDGFFEPILRRYLLNYETAKKWRTKASHLPTRDTQTSSLQEKWKVSVNQDGIYKLTYNQLLGAGVPVNSIDPRTFKIFYQDNEIAIYVKGEDDGVFDENDYILFYGQKRRSRYSDTSIYWLSYNSFPGLRMNTKDGSLSGSGIVPETFLFTAHAEKNLLYAAQYPKSEDTDHWWWTYVLAPAITTKTFSIHLPFLTTSPFSATVRIKVMGITAYPDISPDHNLQVELNGHLLGEEFWDGQTELTLEYSVPSNYLMSGQNSFRLIAPGGTDAPYDQILVDWFEITYRRTFSVENNKLLFSQTSNGSWEYHLKGFTTSNITIYDISDPLRPQIVTNAVIEEETAPYTLKFEDTVSDPRTYLAITSDRYLSPIDITKDIPSNLHSTANNADYIVISPSSFKDAIQPLIDYRASQGLRVFFADIQDIYDEFNYGMMDAKAIRDFIQYAYENWQPPAPSFVLLVGDGTYDFKNYLGTSAPTFIPPYLAPVDPWIVETAAENRFVTVSGPDNFPDLFLGRLPANSPEEVTIMVNKILNYEQNPASGEWIRKILFTTDNSPDPAGDFYALSDDIVNNHVPSDYIVDKVYLGDNYPYENPSVQARTAIINAINEGRFLVQYIGHGDITKWSAERILSSDAISSLTNAGKFPLFLDMTCLTGYFHHPTIASIAETALRAPDAGAIATFSATGLGVATGHDYLNRGFFDAMFQDGLNRLGPITLASKLALYTRTTQYRDLIDTFALFGDPALILPITSPTPPIPPVSPTPTPTATPETGSIGGFVFLDTNDNGTRDYGEFDGISGVRIDLTQPDNSVISTHTVGDSGWYEFTNLLPGTYTVTEIQPAGYASTSPDSVTVDVSPNAQQIVNFGEKPVTETPTPTPTVTPTPTSTPSPSPTPTRGPTEELYFPLIRRGSP